MYKLLDRVPSYGFVNLVSFLVVVVFSVGHIFWLLERKSNSEQFEPLYFQVTNLKAKLKLLYS